MLLVQSTRRRNTSHYSAIRRWRGHGKKCCATLPILSRDLRSKSNQTQIHSGGSRSLVRNLRTTLRPRFINA